jgi:hypothetical protein
MEVSNNIKFTDIGKDFMNDIKQNTRTLPEVISLRITALRFLLSVLVVFSHNNYTSEMIAEAVSKGGITHVFCPNKFTIWLQYIISNLILKVKK